MPLNHLEGELRGRARELIARGTLSCEEPRRLWGGRTPG